MEEKQLKEISATKFYKLVDKDLIMKTYKYIKSNNIDLKPSTKYLVLIESEPFPPKDFLREAARLEGYQINEDGFNGVEANEPFERFKFKFTIDIKGHKIFKISMGYFTNDKEGKKLNIDPEKEFEKNNLIVMYGKTGKNQGRNFQNTLKIDDYIYLTYGQRRLSFIARVTGEFEKLNKIRKKLTLKDDWICREVEVIKRPVINETSELISNKKAWLPSGRSTFKEIKDIAEANKILFNKYYNVNIMNSDKDNSTQKKNKKTEKQLLEPPKQSLNQILYGPPGTGKTYKTKELAVKIIEGEAPKDREELTDRYNELVELKQIRFTTFHQSMSYEDFIEGIKPKVSSDNNGEIEYEVKAGLFKEICELAKNNPNQKYVLIIDEINRGNVSAIFGELITLIEEDKRAGEDEEIKVVLPYSKKIFSVPKNIYIIGTMNTADRSVEALDTALRRRFSFTEMLPKTKVLEKEHETKGKITEGDKEICLVKLLEIINKRIELLIDKDHQIGHSYFLKVKTLKDLKNTFKDKIIPLLEEYFYGDFGKIGLVLGEHFVEHKETNNKEILAKNHPEYDTDFIEDKKLYEIVSDENWKVKSFKFIYENEK